MKGRWLRQKPGGKPNAVPLDFFSCLYHTILINRQEAFAHEQTIPQGTPANLSPKSSGRDDPCTGQRHDRF